MPRFAPFARGLAGLVCAAACAVAAAQGVIKIGELNSYKSLPQSLGPYKLG